ncbi:MAG: 50S ribosomal protein L25 [Planctomycetota bacterium]|jgi:large subunit ribosomal protein L25
MQILDLPVEKRETLGSAASRRHCRAGQIPSVLYGAGRENVPLVFGHKAFEQVLKAHTALVQLKFGDVKQTALVREITWDTFGEFIQHVDLQRVDMSEEIRLEIPAHFLGVPAGTAHGGALQVIHKEVAVYSRVDSIPSEIEIDVNHLELGDRVTAGELNYPENVRAALEPDEPICFVKEPKIQEIEAPAVEGVEGEEPAEGEAAEGEGETSDDASES